VKMLEGLRIRQRCVERLGCIKGCLEYLGSDLSFPWLYGGTGHAFIISLDPGVDVSSPDSWGHQPQYDLGRNLGYAIDGYQVWAADLSDDVLREKQREAWDFVRDHIDRGIPCFGFELKAYYGGYWVIFGYEEETRSAEVREGNTQDAVTGGYYYSGWEEGGPLTWDKLGALFIPNLEVRSVELCPAAPDLKIVRDGLGYALKHAQNPPEWIEGQAKSGPTAWAYWAEALETGEAKRDHHTYNLKLWLECREMAVAFCQEAKERLPGRCDALFGKAVAHYDAVCTILQSAIILHPVRDEPDWGPESTFTSAEAAALIRQAAEADGQGLVTLQRIVEAL
jgi:hypothetical protein